MINNYPLSWPHGWPRTEKHNRKDGRFSKKGTHTSLSGASWQTTNDITISNATDRILTQLGRMRADEDFVISTNLKTRLDGLPRSSQRMPEDSGVAVYWKDKKNKKMSIAIDIYEKVEHNMAAIAATLDALRGIERWGGAQIIERAFMGFAALDAPTDIQEEPWWEILNTDKDGSAKDIELAYKRARRKAHPDSEGGSDLKFIVIESAYKTAKAVRGFS